MDGPSEPAPEYLGSESCKECHEEAYRDWIGSDHHLAMQRPTDEYVRGDFDGAEHAAHGERSTFLENEDGEYVIRITSANGKTFDHPVRYTFGIRPLQQYLIPSGKDDGRLQAYTTAWDTEKGEWFHLHPDEQIDQNDELHWSRHNLNWNLMCAECHSTDVRKDYDIETNTYETKYAEVSVGCESCHGPGSRHVELANAEDQTWENIRRYGLTVRLKDVPVNLMEIDVCAKCHSRRRMIDDGFRPGNRFLNHYTPELLEEDLYFPDGQIRDEVFVYGSFLQSRMYRENVRCTDCHHPHTEKLKFTGNALCTQCHRASDYDTPLHHHHEVNTEGASCIECHMPDRTYMVVDPRRDHSMRIPRPDLTVRYGVPNACNECHTKEDETPVWAAKWIEEWYGPDRPDDPQYAHAFVAARNGEERAIEMLIRIVSRPKDYGPMTRATAASLLGRFADRENVTDFLRKALRDRNALIRVGAVRAMDGASPEARARLLRRSTRDPSKAVRVEAGRVLARLDASMFDRERDRESFRAAVEEYEETLRLNADYPSSQLNAGVLYADRGEIDKAIRAYEQALRINSTYVPALTNLALVRYERGEFDEAERLLRRAVRAEPDFTDGHFMLGMLLGEQRGRIEEAVDAFRQAAALDPDRADLQYNLAVALHQAGRFDEAEPHYLRVLEIEPDALAVRRTLLDQYLRQQRWDDAREQTERLIELQPDNPTWERVREAIDRRDR